MDHSNYLRTEIDGDTRILTITIDRVNNDRNQLSTDLIRALESILKPQLTNPEYRGIILTTAREKVFSTGADIETELINLATQLAAARFCRAGRQVFELFSRVECPTIAAISGFALGGGCEITLHCDFRIAAKNARIGLPEINLGVIPGWGGTQLLQRLIGRPRAMKMILGGDPINATTALEYGLIDQIVETHADLVPAAKKFLAKFAAKSPRTVGVAKRAMIYGSELPLRESFELESDMFALAWSNSDREEGITAFMEKRRPKWPD